MLSTAGLRREDILKGWHLIKKNSMSSKPKVHEFGIHPGTGNKLVELTERLSSRNDLPVRSQPLSTSKKHFLHQQENCVKSTEQEIRFYRNPCSKAVSSIELNVDELQEKRRRGYWKLRRATIRNWSACMPKKKYMEKGLSEAENNTTRARETLM